MQEHQEPALCQVGLGHEQAHSCFLLQHSILVSALYLRMDNEYISRKSYISSELQGDMVIWATTEPACKSIKSLHCVKLALDMC